MFLAAWPIKRLLLPFIAFITMMPLVGLVKVAMEAQSLTAALPTLVIPALGVPACLTVLAHTLQLSRRLRDLAEAMNRAADGDLTVTVDVRGGDEVAQMGVSLNTMVTELRALLSSVSSTSGRIEGTAESFERVAASVGDAAEQASRQADLAAQHADEVSHNARSVASGSEEMSTSIADIARSASEAMAVATDAVHTVEATTDTMGKLGDSSREVGDVIRLITSIAAQTNLLALNAHIEAARAGDAGRGFAVVADEVKQLAQETAWATEDISRRVAAIQADAEAAARSIGEISGVIGRINEYQTTVASAVEQQTATTQAINAGINDAAASSERIAHNISGVAQASDHTASAISGTHDSAQQLAAMGRELRQLVNSYQV